MLAEHPLSALPMGDHANLDYSDAIIGEDRICPGCRNTVVTEDGGVVVAFGQSFFHVDCFKCAKCNNQVTADTNLLLLSDGSPVCANCSYCCNVCKLPILDEAIMTGDDSYHAHCFNCKVCKKRIDELVFAKTSQGIYCMDCHNERVARSRRHQQRKEKERARERAAAEASSRARDNIQRDPSQAAQVPNASSTTPPEQTSNPQSGALKGRSGSTRSQTKPPTPRTADYPHTAPPRRDSTSSAGERQPTQSPPIGHSVSMPPATTSQPQAPTNLLASTVSGNKRYSTLIAPRPASPTPPRADTAPSGSAMGTTLSAPLQDHLRSTSSPMPRSETLNVPSDRSSKALQKRRSFNDRPLNVLLQDTLNTTPNLPPPSGNDGLLVPGATSRRDKRRSINPGMAVSFNSQQPEPSSSSPTTTSFSGSQTLPSRPEAQPSRTTSPLRDMFPMQRTLSPPPLQESHPVISPPPPMPYIRPLPDPLTGRARSASASTFADVSRSPDYLPRSFSRNGVTLDKVPTRTSSRVDLNGQYEASNLGYPPITPNSGSNASQSQYEGRVSPSLVVPGGGALRSQNSFENRSRSGTPTFNGSSRPTSLTQTIEIPANARGGSGPASPAHRVDVPRGVESGSGTDTEVESEEGTSRQQVNGQSDTDDPPSPPPKEGANSNKVSKIGTRPPELRLERAEDSDIGLPDSEDLSELSHESSPIEHTSHATFIAPALPPIRFSMSGADFAELLKSVGGSQSSKSSLNKVAEVNGEMMSASLVDGTFTPQPSGSVRASTPTSDITVLAPGEPSIDDGSRMRRGEALRNRRADTDQTPRRNHSVPRNNTTSSPNSSPSSSANDPTMHTIARSRNFTDGPKRSLDYSEFSGQSDASRSSIDLPSGSSSSGHGHGNGNGHVRSLSNVRNGLPAHPAPEGRSNHQRTATAMALSYSAPNSAATHIHASTSNSNGNGNTPRAQITVTSPENNTNTISKLVAKADTSELVRRRLQEAVVDATKRGATHVKLNMEFISAIVMLLDQRRDEFNDMNRRLDGFKRTSQQYMDGLTVAQTEYDKELKARREAEAEVARLRVLLSGQAFKLTAISGETKRQEAQKQLSREMSDNLSSLERDLSKLKAERDMTLAEVEELAAKKSGPNLSVGEESAPNLGRTLSVRFDNIKSQYLRELTPLTEQREVLLREIAELKASRDACLEETTILNARNEELAQLNAAYLPQFAAARIDTTSTSATAVESATSSENGSQDKHEVTMAVVSKASLPGLFNPSTTTSSVALSDESIVKVTKPEHSEPPVVSQFKPKLLRGWGSKAAKEHIQISWPEGNKRVTRAEHTFQQISVLMARCGHCGDKMWGSQLRCQDCNIAVHTRCVHHVSVPCAQHPANGNAREEPAVALAPVGPSLFGRDLTEQVRADSKGEQRSTPVIVEKCIDAVDFLGLEYEGIYRKTGGSRSTKTITQLFERGDYASFDLRDEERFNDICSITSVLKTYFRSLPNPLFTFELHDGFIAAASMKEVPVKTSTMKELIAELPAEHYHTTRALMLHLHRVCEKSETNLMNSRNLGTVFGPTLMRSRDPNAEFTDMAGKALCVEFLVENAPTIFERPSSPSA